MYYGIKTKKNPNNNCYTHRLLQQLCPPFKKIWSKWHPCGTKVGNETGILSNREHLRVKRGTNGKSTNPVKCIWSAVQDLFIF